MVTLKTDLKILLHVCASHLADLVEGVLSISSSVFEVVVSWECPVNVPGDGTVLRGLLTNLTKADKKVKVGEKQ